MTTQKDVGDVLSDAGMEQVRRLGSEAMVAHLHETSPVMARLLVDVALGDVLGRPDLDTRTRELLAVAMLSAGQADTSFLGVHVRAALDAGASPADLIETIMQVATFAGFPPALRALGVLRAEFGSRGVSEPVPRSARAVVLDFLAALGRDETQAALAFVAPDALWSIPGDSSILPWVGQRRGRDAVEEFYRILGAETEREAFALGPVIAHGESVYVRGEFAYRFPVTGGHYAGTFVIVFTVREGLIERYEMHEDSLGLARAYAQAG